MADLYKHYDDMNYDGLVTDVLDVVVDGGTIRKLGTAGTLKRGTILAKSSGSAGDNKLVILGTTAASNETLTAYAILCDDTAVGTASDVVAPIFKTGRFDLSKCTVATSYTITEADKDALRDGGIFFKAPQSK